MTWKDSIKKADIVYYLLDNYNLEELEIESEIMADGRKEITFKRLGTDEGGREGDEK